ncbi:MAG TPA: hypothetical protein VH113_09720 [Gemmatimonadales bacterium]|jgi:hypothetical protein|nr:hypothetical protein [Gemmatimonadales bacterium]
MTDRPRGFTQPKAAADLVKSIVQQKVDDAKQLKADVEKARQKRKSTLPLLLGLTPVLLGLTAWNVFTAGPPKSTLTAADQTASTRFRIYIAAQAIEAYRASHGTYPANLTQVGVDWQGLHYAVADTTWSIVARLDSLTVTYRHGDPLAPFATAYQSLQRRKK